MQTVSKINGERLYTRIMELGEIGKNEQNGVERRALSKEDKEAHILVSKWMEEAGLTVSHDNFGNLIGRIEGTKPQLPAVMIGSHIDSVRNGGRFDGIIGVLAGIEIAHAISLSNLAHEHPIEVVAFCEEEGSRFNDGLFGSRGMVGKITKADFNKVDENHVTRYEALKSFGYGINPDCFEESIRTNGEIKLYLEMHIEQGPYLDTTNQSVGIVQGIAGPAWYTIKLEGVAGHAGTVPMSLRNDPLVGAAELIVEVDKVCSGESAKQTVGTVGIIQAYPGGSNIIPNVVEFSLDLRDINLSRRNRVFNQIETKLKQICKERGLAYTINCNMEIDPVECSKEVVDRLSVVSETKGITAPIMVSGAGHDAMLLAEITDIGMIFVRCRDGISHNPKEWAEIADIINGTEILFETVLNYI
ncbi:MULTISPECIES: hydantoinase/carbamoylase family amidase [Bacillaceae]|uniref:hydantoinase/carbamoylase family amidase n=1 Tax=Bacillaceae TaxID=186817 RepID=UPI002FFEC2B6